MTQHIAPYEGEPAEQQDKTLNVVQRVLLAAGTIALAAMNAGFEACGIPLPDDHLSQK